MARDNTRWGAFDESLARVIKQTVKKLEDIGIPAPTKIEASALVAYREENNIRFMSNEEIKKFIMGLRGYKF